MDQPENLEAYMDLGKEDIARLVLCLLIEERLKERLAEFREDLTSQPVQSKEKLLVAGSNVMPVSHPLR